MVELRLVPKREPTPKEKVLRKIKAHPKPDGALYCPECGGRSAVTVEVGATVKNGRRKKGTILMRDVCDVCRLVRDKIVQMRTDEDGPKGV